eukprot:TRINITY_DN1296_c1_g1_i2.p1 TRINITY_DN1296_c1_g1~~TRINITY_DN1296_c1_g1_i2.p1  ORF type:complete len:585 (-),score=212.57 TRINITY_DN1296_c1_g1_i2:244-1998(-)
MLKLSRLLSSRTTFRAIRGIQFLKGSSLPPSARGVIKAPSAIPKFSMVSSNKDKEKDKDSSSSEIVLRKGVLPFDAPTLQLFSNKKLIIGREMEYLDIFMGFKTAQKYTIRNQEGELVGFIVEEDSLAKSIARNALRSHRSFSASILDVKGQVIFKVVRPMYLVESKMEVQDKWGNLIGEVHMDWHLYRRKYTLFLRRTQFAKVDAPILAWQFPILDRNEEEMAIIDRNFTGLLREMYADAGRYVVHFGERLSDEVVDEEGHHIRVEPRSVDIIQDNISSSSSSSPSSSSSSFSSSSSSFPSASAAASSNSSYMPLNEEKLAEVEAKKRSKFLELKQKALVLYQQKLNSSSSSSSSSSASSSSSSASPFVPSTAPAIDAQIAQDLPLRGRSLVLDERSIALALAIAVDYDYFSRYRPGVGQPWFFPWGGWGGGGGGGEGTSGDAKKTEGAETEVGEGADVGTAAAASPNNNPTPTTPMEDENLKRGGIADEMNANNGSSSSSHDRHSNAQDDKEMYKEDPSERMDKQSGSGGSKDNANNNNNVDNIDEDKEDADEGDDEGGSDDGDGEGGGGLLGILGDIMDSD